MTTENQPAVQPAATDETVQQSPQADPPPVAAESLAVDGSESAPADPPAVAESKPPETADSEPAASVEENSTTVAETTSAPVADQPSSETATEDVSTQPPRRVRLNPTVAPDIARPIPSLRPTDPPPAAPTEDSTSDSPEAAVDEAVDAALSETAAVEPSAPSAPEPPPPPPAEPVEVPSKKQNESLDADLEAELEAAMVGEEQQAAVLVEAAAAAEMTETEDGQPAAEVPLAPDADVKRGTRLTGTVASIHGDDMFLDFGLRIAGVLSRRQFGLRKQPMQGETLDIVVARIDEKESLMHVNLPNAPSKVRGEWDALMVDQNVECRVTGTNKGGLEISIGALRGFMPASQVDLGFVPDLNVYVGQTLTARIAEVNPKRRKLVLSRRAILEEEREGSQKELFEKIAPGQQYTGRVRSLKDYGAFVDIGGADGLLHVAQISWSRINHPSEVLKEGEEIEVQVLSVDKEKKRISLGMRQLKQNPWKAAEAKFAQGAQVKGKVTRIETFGAFIELAEGVEGLAHISELDHKRVNRVADVLRVGQEVDVQVLEVDSKRKRVSLSLKALKEKPEDPRDKAESAPIVRQRSVDSLVGGTGDSAGGQLFGDPNKFGG